MDYTREYLDTQAMLPRDWERLETDFVAGLAAFVADNCMTTYAFGDAIARSLLARMSVAKLHYHTPYHIMQMFAFANQHGIQLQTWERLAVWFHDAVYWPGTGFGPSEWASAQFMQATLPPQSGSEKMSDYDCLIMDAKNGILATADHLSDTIAPLYYRLLDLDVNTFLATGEMAKQVNECLRLELCPHDKTKWFQGRVKFLEGLVAKGHVFRSPEFQQFDREALDNIRSQIEEARSNLQ